jgi:hypothetical protein
MEVRPIRRITPDQLNRRDRHCQSKIDYFAQALESHFTAVDFPKFFGINPSGSTAASSDGCLKY